MCHSQSSSEWLKLGDMFNHSPGRWGPGFEGLADRAATRVPGLSAEEYIRQSIVDPEAYIVEGNWPENEVMPTSYAEAYSEQDINDLVAFLMSQ